MKNHSDYITYTPEVIDQLNTLVMDLPRAEGVKAIASQFELSDRRAREIYSKYIVEGFSPKLYSIPDILGGRKIRRLIWDLETSPNIGTFWKCGYKLNIDHDNIIKERAIICIGYKWTDEEEVHCLTWDENQDDKEMLKVFLEIANQADEMVAHNGLKFDLPWFKTRCLFHGLQPMPDYKLIDTLTIARRKFYFNSNRLDYIAKFLGLEGKIKTGFGLWKDILLNKCPKAMALMCEYCRKDVLLLEEVWRRLSALVSVKTHVGVLAGGEKWQSPYTGADNVEMIKTRVTANGTVQYQMRDLTCGSYYVINAVAYAEFSEAKKQS